MSKITHVNLVDVPLFGNIYSVDVKVKTEDNDSEVKIFNYYPDEISFTKEELVGLTIQEANELRHKKDVAYLQS